MTSAVRNGELPDQPLQASSNYRLEPREWDEKERIFIIKPALQNDRVGMGIPPRLVSEALIRDDHAGEKRSAGRLMIELPKDLVD
jgi:hypothetical protein